MQNAAFGLLIEKANRAKILNNVVQGPDEGPLGLRGDGIRLWETRDSEVRDNHVIGCRDMVVWYSSDNEIVRNTVVRSRYGTHFMYSHGNHVEGNRLYRQCGRHFHHVQPQFGAPANNLLARSSGPGGMGLGIKESGNLTVSDNACHREHERRLHGHCTARARRFQTPSRTTRSSIPKSPSSCIRAQSETRFWATSSSAIITQLQVEGGGHALEVDWNGNSFDDYAGYDMDRDGFGDIPYELRRLSSQLESTYPQLQFYRGAITLALLDAISSLFPMVEAETTMIDPRPRMGPGRVEDPRCALKAKQFESDLDVSRRFEASTSRYRVAERWVSSAQNASGKSDAHSNHSPPPPVRGTALARRRGEAPNGSGGPDCIRPADCA